MGYKMWGSMWGNIWAHSHELVPLSSGFVYPKEAQVQRSAGPWSQIWCRRVLKWHDHLERGARRNFDAWPVHAFGLHDSVWLEMRRALHHGLALEPVIFQDGLINAGWTELPLLSTR